MQLPSETYILPRTDNVWSVVLVFIVAQTVDGIALDAGNLLTTRWQSGFETMIVHYTEKQHFINQIMEKKKNVENIALQIQENWILIGFRI